MLSPLPKNPSERPVTLSVNTRRARFGWVSLFLVAISFCAFAQSDLKEQVGRTDIGTALKELNSAAAQAQPIVDNPGQSQQLIRIIPFGRKSGSGIKQQAPVGAHLTYFGGPVISNVQVIVVFWGPNVASAITANGTIDQFFTDITSSRYFDELTEYTTAGVIGSDGVSTSNQTIGHGTFGGKFTITPANCPETTLPTTACTVTDAQIQTELTNQINNHVLPAPQTDVHGIVNTYYAVYFPPSVTISLDPTTKSCAAGGFCAYHSNTASNIPYGVMPDYSAGGCSVQGACGSGTTLQIATGVSSHEMAEAITDAQVGSASVFGPPLAWYDNPPNLGEIADLCDQNPLSSVSVGSTNYTVESLFSNLQNACVFAPPVFNLALPLQVGPNSAFNANLTIRSSVDGSTLTAYTGTVHFTSPDPGAILPADYTFVAADAGTHSFSFTLSALGSQTITVTDTHSSGFTGSASANVNTNADLTISKSHTGSFLIGQTGAIYSITASNVGGGASSGTVTVTDILPAGLTATAISGKGWSCTLATLTCTRADALAGAGSSYPVITVTVDVTSTTPAFVINTATISGGGDTNPSGNNSAIDPTTIAAPIVDLRAAVVANTSVIQGTNGFTFTTSVSNVGTLASNAAVFVNNTLGQGLTATSISGTGWNCTLATVSCTRTDSLAPGAAYPDITVTLNIALNAPGSTTIVSVVSGGGSGSNSGSANLFVSPVVSIVSNTASTTVTAGQAAQYLIGMSIGSAAGTTTFGCSGLPTAATCSFSPTSLTASGNVTMFIATTARGSAVKLPGPSGRSPLIFLALLALGGFAFMSLRNQRRLIRRLAPALGTAVLVAGILAGCGGGGPPPPPPVVGTPAGTYTITFTATSPNGTASRTMSLIVR